MMIPSTDLAHGRPFDDLAFVRLCTTGQIDNMSSLLDVEKRYAFSGADCNSYRNELDTAAGAQVAEGASSNTDWRWRISRWLIRASDELSISRETAIIALSYCDRFLLKKKISRHLFQVVAITCVFVASKLFEKRPIKMDVLMNYTQEKFDRTEVISMEDELVASLGSYLYPPTAGYFCLMFLSGYPCDSMTTSVVIETCQFMIELAASDFFFVAHKQSRVAVAALLVTMEQMRISPEMVQTWLSNIKSVIDFTEDLATMACVKQLRQIYTHNQLRINSLDAGKINVIATAERGDRKRLCRAATPSPTPEDEPEHELEGADSTEGGQCKRQRT